jgi:hypothetical protein
MTESDWQPLPTPMWPTAAWSDCRRFHAAGVHAGRRTDMGGPWGSDRRDLGATGTADTFEAAKEAALFAASAPSPT